MHLKILTVNTLTPYVRTSGEIEKDNVRLCIASNKSEQLRKLGRKKCFSQSLDFPKSVHFFLLSFSLFSINTSVSFYSL